MQRYAVLYLATLIVLIPVDFLFLGIVAKGFFTAQVGDMLGEIRLGAGDRVLSAVCRGRSHVRQRAGECDLAVDTALWRAVRPVLLRDLRPDVAVAAQALDLAGGDRRVSWGAFVTALSSTAGLLIANWLAPKFEVRHSRWSSIDSDCALETHRQLL